MTNMFVCRQMLKNQFWASLVVFWMILNMGAFCLRFVEFLFIFISCFLMQQKKHQHIFFQSLGVSPTFSTRRALSKSVFKIDFCWLSVELWAFEHKSFYLGCLRRQSNNIFCIVQVAKRKTKFFLSCRYSAGTYLMF